MRWIFVAPYLLVVLTGCSSVDVAVPTGFLSRQVELEGTSYPYVVYLPESYRRDRNWPVVLFLHGAGERGSDGWRQTEVGLGRAVRWNPERFNEFIIVFPQAPADTRWIGQPALAAMRALDQTIRDFRGDPDRIYLTGLSMGGYGSWYLATAYRDRFAAVVTVCGGIVPPSRTTSVVQLPITTGAENPYRVAAEAMPDIPVWIFHGTEDPVIPVAESQSMAAELRRLGRAVRYTEYPGTAHNSWDKAYGEVDLWRWMAAQRRAAR